MKTPEQMATEFLLQSDCAHSAFLAGYQAAKDEEATKDQKIAELWTESIKKMLPSVHEVVLFPSQSTKASDSDVVAKMDAAIKKAKGNSLNNSDGWISVKERLPAPQEEVLWWNKAAQQAGVSSYEYMPLFNDTMIDWGDAGNVSIKNFTHWMPLPKPPEDK